jgi:hypothetical protein
MTTRLTQTPGPYSMPRPRVVWGGGTDANTTQSSLTTAALELAAEGLPVFPCNSDKKPIVEGGFKSATQDPGVIREMFARGGAALIGIPTGPASGHVVIDVDPRHGGDAWLRENQNRLPSTLTHGTPRGGVHLVFRAPDVGVRNSQGRIALGVDVRGAGGYAIVPPSEGYTIKHSGAPADMPPWLIKACLKPDPPPPPPPHPIRPPLVGDGTLYGLKALSEECAAIHQAPFGQQEMTLNKAALKIGGLVAATTVLTIPRPAKESIAKVDIPSGPNCWSHKSTFALKPPEPCTKMTVGNRPEPRAIRNTPAIVVGRPYASPFNNCSSDIVRVCTGVASTRAARSFDGLSAETATVCPTVTASISSPIITDRLIASSSQPLGVR